MLTWGRFGPCPSHQVGLPDWRLDTIHFPMKPPEPYSVVIRTGSNLTAKQWGLYTAWIILPAQQKSSASQQDSLQTGFTEGKLNGDQLVWSSKKNSNHTKRIKSLLPYFSKICWTPCNRGHFLSVALEHHGRMFRVGNLKWKIWFLNAKIHHTSNMRL